ncbi:SRPBCC family protein [Actinomadura barringtoniae]|uniref:SRPBCC family protein n=1 Tax=Actinomadura barringtoniae TaxID=1427535 RepID=A0A939T7M0_9ACTN|nr:SRPBCC family protein [Actinomadura barringtoniae]MBO2452154.1 SRPBCC family protein [Actinomadura barringtoniae]
MELDHDFTVPVPVDQAWSVLLDVERVALCVPGATLDAADGEEYTGRLKVKVGAMTITYRGTARIAVADESSRTVSIEASGKEARGSGTANATVQARLVDEGDTTRVTVHTKLNVTGRPAQFGRNILAEVGAKLIARFAKALAKELESPAEAEAEAKAVAPAEPEAPEPKAVVTPIRPEVHEADEDSTDTRPDIPVVSEEVQPAEAPAVPAQRPASEAESADAAVRPLKAVPERREAEAIDLLEVAGPSLAKRAIPAMAAVFAFLLSVRFLVKWRRGRRS